MPSSSRKRNKVIAIDSMALLYPLTVVGRTTEKGPERSKQTLVEFAADLRLEVGILIGQFEAAGVTGLAPEDQVTDDHKQRLLDALRAWHGGQQRKSEVIYQQKLILPSQRILVEEINDKLLRYLSNDPQLIYGLSSRKFEELVARLLTDHGFEVKLTPATRDGGYDVLATFNTAATSFVALVECKKYSPDHRVGVEVVRGLYGVTEMNGANQGLVITSSFFTRGAVEEKTRIGNKMELKDYNALVDWLSPYSASNRIIPPPTRQKG